MRPYVELERDASDKRPFSNGTEGYAWIENWCSDCIHDKPARQGDDGNGCPLILLSLIGKTPVEWMEQPWQQIKGCPEGQTAPVLGDTYHCIEYRSEDDENGPPPPPEPIPGQGELLPREPYEGVRMFADVVAEARQPEAASLLGGSA